MNRRRFLAVSACFAAAPAGAAGQAWQGRAFGAEVSIDLAGPRAVVMPVLAEVQALIRAVEARFSLYDPESELSRLNRVGRLHPSALFVDLMRIADTVVRHTGGLFDPTVQPLWRALAEGAPVTHARAAVGWDRVRFDRDEVVLGAGQALTFNGIAQGFATDLVADLLQARGFTRALVNIGEHRGLGGPWRLGIVDPEHGRLGQHTLREGAIATSSPAATPLGKTGHILHPEAAPRWSSVTVEAERAALADALSTGLVLADLEQMRQVAQMDGVRRVMLVDAAGDLVSV